MHNKNHIIRNCNSKEKINKLIFKTLEIKNSCYIQFSETENEVQAFQFTIRVDFRSPWKC